ncbi:MULTISPECIES: hypothetical protein [unclassified Mycobacterium]|uniref:hypothetical protein n=1 Tax=unclassified Mycobacterium TaxID=2642494 RepID=UPI0029C680F6|nr:MULTISPECIES: hypothetical protein [unclassified Mycobacterium]
MTTRLALPLAIYVAAVTVAVIGIFVSGWVIVVGVAVAAAAALWGVVAVRRP